MSEKMADRGREEVTDNKLQSIERAQHSTAQQVQCILVVQSVRCRHDG
jgi:hypothetical protein